MCSLRVWAGSLLCLLGCVGCSGAEGGGIEERVAKPLTADEVWRRFEAYPGARRGKGEAFVRNGRVVVRSGEMTHECDMETLFLLKPSTGGLRETATSYEFRLLANRIADDGVVGPMRAESVQVQTNLPAVPAVLHAPAEVRRDWQPASRLELDYELLLVARARRAGEWPDAKFVIRSRLVRCLDDGDLDYHDPRGPSWVPEARVELRGKGSSKEEISYIDARPAIKHEWTCAVVDIPDGFKGRLLDWMRRQRGQASLVFTLAEGTVYPQPARWANDAAEASD